MRPGNLHRFQATIRKIWMLRHVDVPEEIGRALEKESGTKKHIPVIASVSGCSVRTTLFPAGAGRYRLQIKTELRKAAGADTGDLIGVEIRYDRESREIEVPSELDTVLKDHPKARRAFDDMPPGHKRQLLLVLPAREVSTRKGERGQQSGRSPSRACIDRAAKEKAH